MIIETKDGHWDSAEQGWSAYHETMHALAKEKKQKKMWVVSTIMAWGGFVLLLIAFLVQR